MVDLSDYYLSGATVAAVGSAGPATLTLDGTVIAASARLLTEGTPSLGNVIEANGVNWNFGTITLYLYPVGGHNPAPNQGNDVVTIGPDPAHPKGAANLVNDGTISASYGAVSRIEGLTANATLTNNGVIEAGELTIDAKVAGHGTISFFAPYTLFTAPPPAPLVVSSIEFDRGVGAGQTIDMTNDATLVLKDPRDFHAVIENFTGPKQIGGQTAQDTLDFLGLDVTRVGYAGNAAQGTLTVQAGGTTVGRIGFDGDYTAAQFAISHDGHGNSQITLA